jgi:hypothetical protein
MPQLIKKLACAFISACTLLCLAACGPGTGGTGTGPILNAATNNVSGDSSATSTSIGSETAIGTWKTLDAKASVLIAADKITVVSNCIQFTFPGAWVIDANQSIVRQNDINSLLIKLRDQQLSFAIRKTGGEITASGAGLNKTSLETTPPAIPCPTF